ncbi:MAG TPA: ThuA domain-containing protein [Pirellulales bacterium]|jgi:type 1 glutamine amidotransferase
MRVSVLFGLIVAIALGGVAIAADKSAEKKKILLVGQQRDNHPATTHEFLPGLHVLEACLKQNPAVEVTISEAAGAWDDGPDLIRRSDAVVLYVSEGAKFISVEPRRRDALAQLAARGGGLTALHWGTGCRDAQYVEPFVKLFGGCHGGPDRKYQVLETTLKPADAEHPAARGLTPIEARDEFYYRLKVPPGEPAPRTLLTAAIDGEDERVGWTWERPDGGRSFGFTGLHFHENWSKPFYRRAVTNGVLWTLKLDIPKEGSPVDVDEALLKLK